MKSGDIFLQTLRHSDKFTNGHEYVAKRFNKFTNEGKSELFLFKHMTKSTIQSTAVQNQSIAQPKIVVTQ